MIAEALHHVGSASPPAGLARPLAALWWLNKGGLAMGDAWQEAHALCQIEEGEPAHDAVHALAHWIEGDEANAAYWYRRCGRKRAASIATEWRVLAQELSARELSA